VLFVGDDSGVVAPEYAGLVALEDVGIIAHELAAGYPALVDELRRAHVLVLLEPGRLDDNYFLLSGGIDAGGVQEIVEVHRFTAAGQLI